jgi:hypothetical protein
MKKMISVLIFLGAVFLILSYKWTAYSIASKDKDFSIRVLGNPYASEYAKGEDIYARNIWDMQFFKGKIYLGAGNSSNEGPAQNAGRVPLYVLDPEKDAFSRDYKVAEEQIDVYRVFNGILYIPGHDATQRWEFGNIYRNPSGVKWEKVRTIPNALHVYDLLIAKNKIFAGGSIIRYGAVFVSEDNGRTWTTYKQGRGRVYTLFELGNKVFSAMDFRREGSDRGGLYQWIEGKGFKKMESFNRKVIFPETTLQKNHTKIIRNIRINEAMYYIGAYAHNDHQNRPFGFYKMNSSAGTLKTERVKLEEGFTPRDFIIRNGKILLLGSQEMESGFRMRVFDIDPSSSDSREELLFFDYPAFARSLEEYKGCYYFGMGSEVKEPKSWNLSELKSQTGDIVKICPSY